MPRDTVVVTHQSAWWQFSFLMDTLDRYASEPQSVIVVVNEPPHVARKLIRRYSKARPRLLEKHNIEFVVAQALIPGISWPKSCSGWVWQQALKILVYQRVKSTDYLVVDSKNFFVAEFTAADIVNSRPDTLKDYMPQRRDTTQLYCEWYGVEFDDCFMHNITPFVMKTSVCAELVNHHGGAQAFAEWFYEHAYTPGVAPMEFHLYDVFARRLGQRDRRFTRTLSNYSTLWQHSIPKKAREKSLSRILSREILVQRGQGVVVSGMHKDFIATVSLETVKGIMRRLGLSTEFACYHTQFIKHQQRLWKTQ